jgi:hypothetical protein
MGTSSRQFWCAQLSRPDSGATRGGKEMHIVSYVIVAVVCLLAGAYGHKWIAKEIAAAEAEEAKLKGDALSTAKKL